MLVGLLPRMVDILDEPTGDPAAINTLLMSEERGGREAQSPPLGMGVDELFLVSPHQQRGLRSGRPIS